MVDITQRYCVDSRRLLSSPEYRLRDWSFLTARPSAFFWPTTTSNCLARVTNQAHIIEKGDRLLNFYVEEICSHQCRLGDGKSRL
jgi:hypothetical protein